MIFNSSKIYAKVWQVKPAENGKYIDLQITTSEKGPDGNYINSGWFPRVIGHAVNSLKDVCEGDNIIITKSKFTNERYVDRAGAKKSYFRFVILEAELDTDHPNKLGKPKASSTAEVADDEEDPW